ncbi:hypothetical protein [Flyfo microvirus Tbat2_93]|nr:hypothetical protein [Flyfo microvirus Tbat2_93]
MTNAERQRKFREAMKEQGLVQVTVWVHDHQAADVKIAAQALALDNDLEIGTLRNVQTGRYRRK